ncbi:MAG TPA: hypothetical protein VFT38_01105 [Vicinamibacteria bacterium]|nr:hypothetical protein [Vicinamibacteria bacterium]
MLVAPPASAADVASPSKTPSQSGLAARTSARLATLAPSRRAFAQAAADPSASSPDTRSFFRTPTGVAAIVLMVAGAAFVAYRIPKDNQKVHSPIR